jgi:pimeloyl-ACP methyl ester carboxylesterase
MGHSFGTNMASCFMLAHPERVAGLLQIVGLFLGPWREADRAARRARRSDEQQARLDELHSIESRTDAEETEYLTPRRLGTRLNSEVTVIPGAGHDPWLEAPGQFGAVLRAAVKRQRLC